jgi:farnesyl diphosphate synthase
MQRQLDVITTTPLDHAMAHLLGRGKLFRPLLLLATARAVSGDGVAKFCDLATTVELIHTFTLIHDDLPCMDDARLRRGVPAVHIAYDEATAVLAGDALQNWAIHLLCTEPPEISATIRLALVRCATVAIKEVVEGQILDLAGEGQMLALQQLERMHSKKTGALLGACCEMGALLGGADARRAAELGRIGVQIGLAFQIRDDLLSLQSDETTMGKTLETDLAKAKSTYPGLMGIELAENHLVELQRSIDCRLQELDLTQPDVLLEMALAAGQRVS